MKMLDTGIASAGAVLLAATSFAGAALAQADQPINFSELDLSGQRVVWADNGGTVHETYVQAYLDPFMEKTGAEVISDSPFDYARVRAQVEAGNVVQDIITGAPYVIEANCGTLFEPIPESFYQGDINPKYRGSRCAIPNSVPSFLVMYNTAMYADNPPETCADFFDLDAYPGQRGMWNSVIGNGLEIAILADGVAPENVYPMDVERALAKIDTIKSETTFFSNLAVGNEGMTNETYGMLITANTRGYNAVQAGANYAPLWSCAVEQLSVLGILKGTPNYEAAFALANYVVTPEAQSARMAVTAHSPVTSEFTPPDDEEMLSFLAVSHDGLLLMDNAWWAENFDTVEQRFQQWQVE
jgi:putative spermidine/putrescine transport system substrate-binding protein